MKADELEHTLIQVFADVFDISAEEINPQTSPETCESWNSFNGLNLLMALEERFDVTFSMDEVAEFESFAKIHEIISSKESGI